MLGDAGQLETVERLIRRGVYTGPLVLNHVMIGGGADGPNPYNMMEFVRRVPRRRGADHRKPDAQRAAAEHDGHRDGPARARRHRGQPVGPQGRAHDQRAADRADGAHRARAVPRSRHRRAGEADLPDRHAIQERRRDAGQARLRPQPPAPASAARRCAVPPDRSLPERRRQPCDGKTVHEPCSLSCSWST